MSQLRKEEITCPHCHHAGFFELWESVNADLNPELREKILSEDIWAWKCPNCGKITYIPWGTLYHDISNKFLIFFDFEANQQEDKYGGVELPADAEFLENYTIRRVFGLNSFKEKIFILENNLNDVAIERMKYMISHIIDPRIAEKGYSLYFSRVERDNTEISEYGNIYFAFYDEEKDSMMQVRFAMDNYFEHKMAVEMDPRMVLGENKCVDEEWMSRQLRRGLLDEEPYEFDSGKSQYTYPYKEGYAITENGIRKNIKDASGNIILADWYHDIYDIKNGFFIIGMTKRKTKTTPTKYIRGIAHISGIVLFPVMFNSVRRFDDGSNAFYAEIEDSPFILTPDGSIFDPQNGHLPNKASLNLPKLIEGFANWTLPGLQFFYRDTDAPVVVETTYQVGDVLRAGFFVDASTKLLKPAHKLRFLIASAHAAMFCEIDEMVQNNSKISEWRLCTFHFNSYFKVMDVYSRDGYTQVFLLHIPAAAAFFLGTDENAINFINQAAGDDISLVDMARSSFDEKLTMDIHPRSYDQDLVERMHHPIGLDDEFYPLPFNSVQEPKEEETAALSSMIHKLANDEDIKDFIEIHDNFPYHGVKNHVCEGCIYAKGIVGNGEGCGRLFIKAFRDRYIKGKCEYYKQDLFIPSEFERRKTQEAKEAIETREKQSDIFAVKTLKAFIDENLGGDIEKLREVDLTTINSDNEYSSTFLPREDIVKAILVLCFDDVWPDLNVDSINHYNYYCSQINTFQRLLGSNIMDKYFMGLQKFNPSEDLHRRCLKTAHLTNTIGNLWVLPNKDSFDSHLNSTKYHGYADQFLKAMHSIFLKDKKVDVQLSGILYKNRKLMSEYQGEEGFKKFVDALLLTDFVDSDYVPKSVFANIWCSMKDLDKQTYFKAVETYCDFCDSFILKRADRMIDKLKHRINNN